MKALKIACIGTSTNLPPEDEPKLEGIGRYIVERGWWLASGNAKQSDNAYARGGNSVDPSRVLLYVVNERHNPHFVVPGNRLVYPRPEWESIAARNHPRYPLLSHYVKQLMIRNAGIVRNADFVIAYLNRTKIGGGGTGHGWRIAGELGIPRLDISIPKNLERAIEELSVLL